MNDKSIKSNYLKCKECKYKDKVDFQIEVLDIMLNDISNTTLNDVQKWLDDTYEQLNCENCEKETMLKYSDLMIEYDKIKRYNKILNDCLDTKDELCKVLREDNENLRYKNELYLEKIKKLEREE